MKTLLSGLFAFLLISTPSHAQAPYAEWVRKTAYNIYMLLAEYDANHDGCVDDPADFQELLQTFITVKKGKEPEFAQLCFKQRGVDDYEVSWELTPTPRRARAERLGQRIMTPDIWTVFVDKTQVNVNGFPLPSASLEREGSAHLTVHGTTTKVSVRGVGFNLNKEIIKRNIPESLLHFGIKSFELSDNGHFQAKVSAPLFAIPVKARGDYDKKQLSGLVISIFGIQFPIIR